MALHLGGYKQRAEGLKKKMAESADALAKVRNARTGLRMLAASEEVAIQNRLSALRDEVAFISRREREAQELYRANKEELDALQTEGLNGYH